MKSRILSFTILFTFLIYGYLIGQVQYYNGNTVIQLLSKNKAKERVCKYYFTSIHSKHPSIKIKHKAFGKWKKYEDGTYLINDEKLSEIRLGAIRLLVNNNGMEDFKELEDVCISAVMSIPYDEVRMNSENKIYISYREKALKNMQFLRLVNVLENRLGDIWIEMPTGFEESYLCQKKSYR